MGDIDYVVGNNKFYGSEVKKSGNVDVKRLYRELIYWFNENKYLFTEKGISSKTKSDGKEQKLEWSAIKKPDNYFEFNIAVEIIVLRFKEDRAEVILRFKGFLKKDYKDKFERKLGKKIGKTIRKMYEEFLIKPKLVKMKGTVWTETNDLITKAKKILNLVTR